MSILIKGMEMPNVCAYCFIDSSECNLQGSVNIWEERHPDCPLVEIPTPHGRLGDLDNIYVDGEGYFWFSENEAPTIIEAEGIEE